MNNIYRDLTPIEVMKALEQEEKRTKYEKLAYRLLPKSMKEKVERNPAVAFVGRTAFFPDLFLREEKMCIFVSEKKKREEKIRKGESLHIVYSMFLKPK